MRSRGLRASLRQLADALGYPFLFGDVGGGVLHETPALRALLEADGEAERIRGEMLDLLAPEHYGNSSPDGAGHGEGAPLLRRTVRTGAGRYRLEASLRALPGRRAPVVLVRVERVATPIPAEDDLRTAYSLTRTEARVALLLAGGKSNQEIARILSISPHTARRHTERVLLKLGVRSRAEVAGRLLG